MRWASRRLIRHEPQLYQWDHRLPASWCVLPDQCAGHPGVSYAMNRGFSLLEVVAVMALLFLLLGLSIWGFGGARERELREKVRTDLIRIDSAKSSWRVDHPQSVFPVDESSRFTAIQPYLKVGLQAVTNLSDLFPNPNLGGTVTYSINPETTTAGAEKGTAGNSFDRFTASLQL